MEVWLVPAVSSCVRAKVTSFSQTAVLLAPNHNLVVINRAKSFQHLVSLILSAKSEQNMTR